MKNALHMKLPLLLIATVFSGTILVCSESSQAGPRRHRHQTSPAVSKRSEARQPAAAVKSLTPEEARQKLAELCAEIKTDYRPISEDDLHRAKKQVLQATNDLIRLIKNDPAKDRADVWLDRLGLEDLRKTLLDEEGPDVRVLNVTWTALFAKQDYEGIRWKIFDPLRLAMRRYFRLPSLLETVKDGKRRYETRMEEWCTTLPEIIGAYSRSRSVIDRQDSDLAIAIEWLEDVSDIEPRAARLANLVRASFSGSNLRIRMSGDFVGAGFQTTIIEEPTDIRENILGTRVVGQGSFSTDSRATLMETPHHAGINVNVAGTIRSLTTGYNHPVTLNTKTEGTIQGDKRIIFSAERIFTTPAQARARLQSQIYNVRVDGGPVVQCIARKQVDKRQGASKAESRRRTEMRMGQRIDERIDERIKELNQRYQEKFRLPLVKTGLFPRIWDLSSSAEAVHLTALIGSSYQPSAMTSPPSFERDDDIFIQVHQSALNNAAVLQWAAYEFDEEKEKANENNRKLREEFEKRFKRPVEEPEREQPEPVRFVFNNEAPIRIGFDGNRVNVLLQLLEIFSQSGKIQSKLNMFWTYDIKIENIKGDDVIVLERIGEPKLISRDDKPLSSADTVVGTIIKKRLGAKIVVGSWIPQGEWEGKGNPVPSFVSAQDGWLTIGYDWVPVE